MPPYSPDFNPIEHVNARLKTHLRSVAARDYETLTTAMAASVNYITPRTLRAATSIAGSPRSHPDDATDNRSNYLPYEVGLGVLMANPICVQLAMTSKRKIHSTLPYLLLKSQWTKGSNCSRIDLCAELRISLMHSADITATVLRIRAVVAWHSESSNVMAIYRA